MLVKLNRIALSLPSSFPGYLPTLRRLRSRSVAIVMYHGVVVDPLSVVNWSHLDASQFEEQIRFLTQEYSVIPLEESVERLEKRKPLPERPAVVTFDDGFRSVATTAFPILSRYGASATVFLVTSLLEQGAAPWFGRLYHALGSTPVDVLFWKGLELPMGTHSERAKAYRVLAKRLKTLESTKKDREVERLLDLLRSSEMPPDSPMRTMNWTEVEALAQTDLITFGSHSHTHPILSRCSPEVQRRELQTSREILQERLGVIEHFAYPNGSRADFTSTTKRLLHECGYRAGLATVSGLNRAPADLYELRRVNVGADTTVDQFELQMVGL